MTWTRGIVLRGLPLVGILPHVALEGTVWLSLAIIRVVRIRIVAEERAMPTYLIGNGIPVEMQVNMWLNSNWCALAVFELGDVKRL